MHSDLKPVAGSCSTYGQDDKQSLLPFPAFMSDYASMYLSFSCSGLSAMLYPPPRSKDELQARAGEDAGNNFSPE